ncbi:DUF6371 domain-containing protein [Chitinophaga varians]|uniref:DUF6371 domain-containing protein n=1 Tax=Chitinophaga varians TaxID=2202339 RepID=UPI00165EE894|nr:DUF6371 domain-containing protein [Chitinophaga varians]MBC9910570.1 hypothetical protein [Chitinophaga varians]
MNAYRYTLERGNKKHVCPGCGRKRFVRFIDTETGEYLPTEYGRCDREVNCGYFHKPDYGTMAQIETGENRWERPVSYGHHYKRQEYRKQEIRKPPVYIPHSVLNQSQQGYETNQFVIYLHSLFGAYITHELIHRYRIGTSGSRWPGATAFWWIDVSGNVRAGQVKQFDHAGHTAKSIDGGSRTTWIHSILKYNHESRQESLPLWLSAYLEQGGSFVSCLYGEHLLTENTGKPVAIVEAPATAIVASIYLPAFVWLAVGSLSYLTTERCQALAGRQVFLFPDLSADGRAFTLWNNKAQELASIASVVVSDLLERCATTTERAQGLDLRDYLTRFDYQQFQPAPPAENKHTLTIDGEEQDINAIAVITEIDGYKLVTYMLRNAKVCDVLYTAAGELVPQSDDFSQVIFALIGKVFKPGKLNGVGCLLLPFKNC